tara:strand:- start:2245 stop:2571 length:327 start_codon:yes stop_codon:yes gene_type:complete
MSDRRTLEFDPLTGVKHDFIFEAGDKPSQDRFVIETTQDVTELIKRNKRSLNDIDRHQPYGEWSKIASLPLSVYWDLKKQGIVDDRNAFKKWLNDPDNKYYRTRVGKV